MGASPKMDGLLLTMLKIKKNLGVLYSYFEKHPLIIIEGITWVNSDDSYQLTVVHGIASKTNTDLLSVGATG